MKFIKELIPYIIILIVVALIREFLVTPALVVGDSMVNTLHNNDVLILDKIVYRFNEIKRFDIVVVRQKGKDAIIKRVIALPGETVEYKDNKLYINGKEMEDPYNDGKTEDYLLDGVIGENEYFVVGDNRSNSADSRMIGLIDKSDIKGRIDFRIFPFTKFGKVK